MDGHRRGAIDLQTDMSVSKYRRIRLSITPSENENDDATDNSIATDVSHR